MNVPQYLLVKGFRKAFPIYPFNLHVAVPCKLQPRISRKKKRMASHFTLEKVGWFPAHVSGRQTKRCEARMGKTFEQFSGKSASRLPEYTSLACVFLAYREYGHWKGDWQCYKHLLLQYHMSWDRPMLLR